MNGIDLFIERKRYEDKSDYIDIIIDFSEENQMDFEDIVKGIHPSIIQKVQHEFIERNMVKGEKIETSLTTFMEGL